MTLLELIVVIVILGILAAIAIPKMNMKKDAQRANCFANVDVIKTALASYYSRQAIQNSAVFPSSLTNADFLYYLNEGKLPKHPTGRVWDAYYTAWDNNTRYTFSSGKGADSGACTAF